jgi:CelD/BcsL family acetyltransferase involved in cellulose biosynthesis
LFTPVNPTSTGKGNAVKAVLYDSPEVFDQLADEWNGLLDPERTDNLFLRHSWQRIWWRHLGRGRLAIVAVRDEEGALRGIGPWFVEEDEDGQRVVRIVGCHEVTDYMDLIAEPGGEEPVFRALLDFMTSPDAPDWDAIDLCNIPENSPTRDLLLRLAGEYGLSAGMSVQDVCPVVTLPDSYDDYLMALDKKQRHELRRKRRRADAQGTACYIVGPEHDLDAEIEAFFELMELSGPDKEEFLERPGYRDFFKEMGRALFDEGLLELLFVTVDGERMAAMWQFPYRGRMLLYNSGVNIRDYAALSPGIVLLTYGVEDAIEKGMSTYDFLRGNETYKYRMGAEDTRVYNVVLRREESS